jgi:hypothetical protein
MPNAAIEVRRQYSRDEEVAIIDAVHAAMIEGLKIPPGGLWKPGRRSIARS